eukprot:evm.model.scf_277.3 EVM.evm.TU.scf_277.3   scf_277:21345-24091(-)
MASSQVEGFTCLPLDILAAVSSRLDFETRCEVLPLVCKNWHSLTKGPSGIWRSVTLEPPIAALPRRISHRSVLRWTADRASSVQELRLRLFDYLESHDFGPGDFADIFSVLSGTLRSLHVLKCGHVLHPNGFAAMSVLTRLETLSIQNWEQGDSRIRASELGWITSLSSLTSVTLEMELDGFPEALIGLTGLQEINLHKCVHARVPKGVSNLKCLKSLAMLECGILSLPPSVCGLAGLEVLNLGMNELGRQQGRSLPDELSSLSNLKELSLCCCEYDTVPPIVSVITSLQVLWLCGNRMTGCSSNILPPSLADLQLLRELHLSCCGLSALPPAVCFLTHLSELYLAGNRLSSLPPNLASLSSLQILDLHRNSFLVVPPVLAHMVGLRKLNLLQNSIVYDRNSLALASLPNVEEMQLPKCGDHWSWSRGGWSTQSFRYFAELICKLSVCSRVGGEGWSCGWKGPGKTMGMETVMKGCKKWSRGKRRQPPLLDI